MYIRPNCTAPSSISRPRRAAPRGPRLSQGAKATAASSIRTAATASGSHPASWVLIRPKEKAQISETAIR